MRRILTSAALASGLLGAAVSHAAAADPETCDQRLARLEPKTASIQDDRTKRLYVYDMKSAHRELAEGDERECREILDHAETLLASAH